MEKYCRAGQATDDNMAHAHCMLEKATNTHTVCVTLIAFPLQQWLHEPLSMLRYAYIACLVLLLGNCYNAYTSIKACMWCKIRIIV